MREPDVDVMLAGMGSLQISEWMAFDKANVLPELRAAAKICAVICNVMGGGKKIWKDADFIPRHRPAEEMESAEILSKIMGIRP